MTPEHEGPGGGAFPWSGGQAGPGPGASPGEAGLRPRPLLARVVGVIVEPVRTMREAAERPAGLATLAFLVFFGLLTGVVMWFRLDFAEMIRDQLEKAHVSLPPAARESAMSGIAVLVQKIILCIVIPAVGLPLAALVSALVLWGISRIVSARGEFRQHFSVVAHAWIPAVVIGGLAVSALLLARGGSGMDIQNPIPSNPAWFLPEDASPFARTFLMIPDLFSVWIVVLLVIGVGAAARLSRGAAAAVVLSPWLLLKVAGALVGGFALKTQLGG